MRNPWLTKLCAFDSQKRLSLLNTTVAQLAKNVKGVEPFFQLS
tara:strand:+ start:1893 stop:2021 length:129 start_codon:yes stop_codon:yes gene_type:complete